MEDTQAWQDIKDEWDLETDDEVTALLECITYEGIVEMPDGRRVEPDHPESPLYRLGMI